MYKATAKAQSQTCLLVIFICIYQLRVEVTQCLLTVWTGHPSGRETPAPKAHFRPSSLFDEDHVIRPIIRLAYKDTSTCNLT